MQAVFVKKPGRDRFSGVDSAKSAFYCFFRGMHEERNAVIEEKKAPIMRIS